MAITALYAAPLALLFFILSVRTISRRREQRVEIGTGEDRELLRRTRVHANFAEYAPLCLVLMGLAESLAAPALLLHALGLSLLIGRVAHAWGLSQTPHNMRARVFGMSATFLVLVLGALACFVLAAMKVAGQG